MFSGRAADPSGLVAAAAVVVSVAEQEAEAAVFD